MTEKSQRIIILENMLVSAKAIRKALPGIQRGKGPFSEKEMNLLLKLYSHQKLMVIDTGEIVFKQLPHHV
jgi:hypothetical protein